MIELSYDTATVRYPRTGMDADQNATFGMPVEAKGRWVQRSFIYRNADGELAQADATLHQAPQGVKVGDRVEVGQVAYRVDIVELKTDPLFGHRHERLVLVRWKQ